MPKPEAEPKTKLGGRIRAVRRRLGDPDRADFAPTLDISKNTLAYYERGERTPDAEVLAKFRERYGVNVNWLVDGTGDMLDDTSGGASLPVAANDFVLIPAYDQRYSAGPGAALALEGAEPNHEMAFSRQWLRRLGINPDRAILAYADGDSMWPTIADCAPMVIDTSIREVRHGFIYAFSLDGYLIVKRINHRLDGSIELISDNRDKYPPQIVDRSRLDQMHIIGRVYLAVQQL